MAHIFKHPTSSQKGIIVFSTVEFIFFCRRKWVPDTKIKRIKPIVERLNDRNLKNFYSKKLEIIREKYFVGLHYGWYTKKLLYDRFVDFHLGGKGTVDIPEKLKQLKQVYPFCSRNFLPDYFINRQYKQKYWDILYVGHAHNVKHVKDLLYNVRKIYDSGKNYRILFIITERKNEKSELFYTDLNSDYDRLFSWQEKGLFTILKLSPNSGMFPINPQALVHFYNSSKIFTIFTQIEGECRVIHEALVCGLPVVVKSDLKGGGRDYLNTSNSKMFDSYDDAHKSLIFAVENYKNFSFNNKELDVHLKAKYSLDRLKRCFSKLYSSYDQEFDGVLINIDELHLRLPAHFFQLAWADESKNFQTAHIVCKKQFDSFYNALKLK